MYKPEVKKLGGKDDSYFQSNEKTLGTSDN
jgi:hypothetical protein